MTDDLSLARIRALFIDLDGVLYRGATALPGAADFIAFLREHEIAFCLITNNATLTPDQYVSKLTGMGIPVGRDELFTSALATALYLQQQGAAGSTAFVVGEDGLREALLGVGVRVGDESPDWVVVGLDRTLTYDKLAIASLAVARGARFVGSNPDLSFPTEAGLVPGAGALQAVVTATTGVAPVVIGKPEPLMFDLALDKLGVTRDETVMLGDRLDTDIEGASRAGLQSIMVLTGVSTRADLEGSATQPALVVEDLPHLAALWTDALNG